MLARSGVRLLRQLALPRLSSGLHQSSLRRKDEAKPEAQPGETGEGQEQGKSSVLSEFIGGQPETKIEEVLREDQAATSKSEHDGSKSEHDGEEQARAEEQYEKYKRKGYRKYLGGALAVASLSAAGGAVFAFWDEIDFKVLSPDQLAKLTLTRYTDAVQYFAEPAKEQLLPDAPALPPGVVQRTLVLGLEDVIVHTEWDVGAFPDDADLPQREHGFRTRKRPGIDAFLAFASQYYEIYAEPVMNTLDPSGYISGRLYRGETRYVDGKHVKDLSFLNRDLRHVIMIDAHPEAFQAQPENGIRIKAWTNDPADRDLVELTPLLEAVFREDVNDIRPLLSQWQGQHVATKFRELNDEYELRKAEGRLPSSSASLLRGVPQQGGPFTLLNIPCGPQAPPPPPASASPPPPPIKEKDPLNIVTGGGLKSLLGK